MPIFPANPSRLDPYQACHFRVQWDGKYVPAVFRVSPLRRITAPVEHRDGGEAGQAHLAPGLTRYEPVVLERGLTQDRSFEQWADLVFKPGDEPSLARLHKDVVLELLDEQRKVVLRYLLRRCWPTVYEALPALDAHAGCVAVERLVLEYEGFERDVSVQEPVES